MQFRRALVATFAAASMLLLTVPAQATVHEITGMLCSIKNGGGNAIFAPPGISGANGNSHRGEVNLALPLFATGFATYIPGGGPGGDDLVVLDDEHPASKITLTGGLFSPFPGLWITDFEFDTTQAWANCFGNP